MGISVKSWVKSYLICICIPYIWLLSHEQFERFIQLIIDRLSPHLFSHQVKHDVVNSQVELLNSLFSVFSPVNECTELIWNSCVQWIQKIFHKVLAQWIYLLFEMENFYTILIQYFPQIASEIEFLFRCFLFSNSTISTFWSFQIGSSLAQVP